jgi:hypothetical protein
LGNPNDPTTALDFQGVLLVTLKQCLNYAKRASLKLPWLLPVCEAKIQLATFSQQSLFLEHSLLK